MFMEFIIKHNVFFITSIVFLIICYGYLYKLFYSKKEKHIKKINIDDDDIKKNNIFASYESNTLSVNHIEAKPISDYENKHDWDSALRELQDSTSDIIAHNKLNSALSDLDINPPKD